MDETRDEKYLNFISNQFGVHAPYVFSFCTTFSFLIIVLFICFFAFFEFLRYRDVSDDLVDFVSTKAVDKLKVQSPLTMRPSSLRSK